MDNIKVNALMLRATDYLENDKILTLLTAEKGKITAGIKGVKKAGAKLKFAAQPFCFAEYILAERGGRYTVTQASECESFYDLRTDVNKFYAACAACETAAALTFEGDGGGGIFYGCVKALTQMCGGDEALALISFLLTSLKGAGYGISTEGCAACSADLSGATYTAIKAAEEGGGNVAAEGKKRALKLLKEYLSYKTEAKCLSLNEFIKLI